MPNMYKFTSKLIEEVLVSKSVCLALAKQILVVDSVGFCLVAPLAASIVVRILVSCLLAKGWNIAFSLSRQASIVDQSSGC